MINPHDGISAQIVKWITEYLPSVFSGTTAVVISMLIDIRGRKPKLYTATGGAICGVAALALSAVLEHFGLPENAGAFVGAIIGFVGADRLRDTAVAVVARRTGTERGNDENQR